MRSREDIESYLMRSNLSYKNVEQQDMWLVRDTSESENIVVSLNEPLLLFRVKVMDLNQVEDRLPLFQRLLELNANDMVHSSYGLANDAVVLTAGLPLENLDYNEFQGTVDDITLALTNHYEDLASFRKDDGAAA